MIRAYYRLAKPGMVYGNALVAIAGYLYASGGIPRIPHLLLMALGLALASPALAS